MGADNLQQIDRWQNWRSIMHTFRLAYLPVRVINWLQLPRAPPESIDFSVIDVALKLGDRQRQLVLYQPTDEPYVINDATPSKQIKTMIVATWHHGTQIENVPRFYYLFEVNTESW